MASEARLRRFRAREHQLHIPLQVESGVLAHPVAQRRPRASAGHEAVIVGKRQRTERDAELELPVAQLAAAGGRHAELPRAGPSRSARLREKPSRVGRPRRAQATAPHAVRFEPARRSTATAAWSALRGAGFARRAFPPDAATRCRLHGRSGHPGGARPAVAASQLREAVVVGPVVLHGGLPLRPSAVEQREQAVMEDVEKARERRSLRKRNRSRTYSVKCSGIGPCGPSRPKKRTPRRGAGRAVASELCSAAGAKSSSGSCERRNASCDGRSARPKRGHCGHKVSTRRSAAKKSWPRGSACSSANSAASAACRASESDASGCCARSRFIPSLASRLSAAIASPRRAAACAA